jgi:hypothetical protein
VNRRALIFISIGALCLTALGLTAMKLLSPTPEQKKAIDHGKLLQLLGELEIVERRMLNQTANVQTESHGIESWNIYQGINLSDIEGIHNARQRVSVFGAQMDRFATLNEQYWVDIKATVQHSDLDEPYASRLKAALTSDETTVYPRYRDWFSAARENAEAVTHYLDVSEHYLGKFKWGDNRLTFTDPKVARDLAKAQADLVAVEEHYQRASGTALQNHATTIRVVLAALRDLEKGMTRHESVYEEETQK